MKKFLFLPIVLCIMALFVACGDKMSNVENVKITIDSSAYVDTVGKIGTRWNIPTAYAQDDLGNTQACKYEILSPSGNTVTAQAGIVLLSEIGAYTVTYSLAEEVCECEPVVYTYYCTQSGEYYAIIVDGDGTNTGELGEFNLVPKAEVFSETEKISNCTFKVLNSSGTEIQVYNGGFIPTVVGDYTIVYESIDKTVDAEKKSVVFTVKDTKGPVITVGELLGNLKYAQKVKLPELAVYDASALTVQSVVKDGNGAQVTVGEDGTITINTQGNYVWTINAEDCYGNVSTLEKVFTVDAYDQNVADGVLSDFDEEFYATDASFIGEGKASVYQSVQALPTAENGVLKLGKGTGASKVGLYFARWTTVGEKTRLYFKIKSDADVIYFGKLDENKLFEMVDIASFGYCYEEKDWQTVWVEPEKIGLTEGNFFGVQILFDGKTDCSVRLDEIGYMHDFVEYTFSENLSGQDLYAEQSYPVHFTVCSEDQPLDSSKIVVSSLDDNLGSVENGTFYAKKKGSVTLKADYRDNGESIAVKYVTLNVGDTVLNTIAYSCLEKLNFNF